MPLRTRLMLMWGFTILVCIALAVIVVNVYSISTDAQIARSREVTETSCLAIASEFRQSSADAPSAARASTDLMNALLELTLREASGVEGGFWHRRDGFVAYAYPTHEGSEVKKDPPETEREPIAQLAAQSLKRTTLLSETRPGTRESLVRAACPVQRAETQLAVWTMTRVPLAAGRAYDRVRLGLGLLLAFVAGMGAWLLWSLSRWSGQLRSIEQRLAGQPAEPPMPLTATGDMELDRIVHGVNDYIDRLQVEKARSLALAGSLAVSERLASLGRMGAGIAHEIRNPLATMRLKAENALVAETADQASALRLVLTQVERVEHLVKSLLLASKPMVLEAREVDVEAWLGDHLDPLRKQLDAAGIALKMQCSVSSWRFDPVHLGRALDNLLDNAVVYAKPGGTVHVTVASEADRLFLRVADDGPGVALDVRARLFEPFVSGRADGTGLGLMIVREIGRAHGGEARLIDSERGAVFEIEIPWPRS